MPQINVIFTIVSAYVIMLMHKLFSPFNLEMSFPPVYIEHYECARADSSSFKQG